MNIDLIAYSQAFLNKSIELLDRFGSILLNLKLDSQNPEQLVQLFEIIESVHDGATTFGMTDAVEMSALQKTLIGHMRRSEIALSANVVDVLMLSRDSLKSRLNSWQSGRRAEMSGFAAMCDLLRRLVASAQQPASDASSTGIQSSASESRRTQSERKVFRVEFGFRGPQWSLNNLLAQLREFGKVSIVTGSRFMHAELVVLESCCLDIETTATKEQIWESLAFVVDPTSIKVTARIEKVDTQIVTATTSGSMEENQLQSVIPLHTNAGLLESESARIDRLIAVANELCNARHSLVNQFSVFERARHASPLDNMTKLENELITELDSLKCALLAPPSETKVGMGAANAARARRAG